MQKKSWQGRTDGGNKMQFALVKLLKFLPLWFVYIFMELSVPFYMIFRRKAYKSCKKMMQIVTKKRNVFWKVYKNHRVFGKCIVDRFGAFAGKRFEAEIIGNEKYISLQNEKEKGFIQLSSHLGNYEMVGYLMNAHKKKVNVIVFDGETETIMKNRSEIFEQHGIKMISVRQDMWHIFEMTSALSNGEVLSMPVDRIFGSERTLKVQFLDRETEFALGAFNLAQKMGVKLISIFSIRVGYGKYRLFVDEIEGNSALELMQNYVNLLEKMLKKYPEQWFNYFDFWNQKQS